MTKVIAISNQKGGVGKTTSTVNLAVNLAMNGKKVLCVDIDPQGNLSSTLYKGAAKKISDTLATAIAAYAKDVEFDITDVIYHYDCAIDGVEKIDFIPSNNKLAGLDAAIEKTMARERILTNLLYPIKDKYDYILIDCLPSLSTLTVNAFTFADSILIPVQPEEYAINGLENLISTIIKVKKTVNPGLSVEGILITMFDDRTNQHKGLVELIEEQAERLRLPVFNAKIPRSIRVSESINKQESIFEYMPKNTAALAYEDVVKEVLGNEK